MVADGYASPEFHRPDVAKGTKSDIWSLGTVVVELFAGKPLEQFAEGFIDISKGVRHTLCIAMAIASAPLVSSDFHGHVPGPLLLLS